MRHQLAILKQLQQPPPPPPPVRRLKRHRRARRQPAQQLRQFGRALRHVAVEPLLAIWLQHRHLRPLAVHVAPGIGSHRGLLSPSSSLTRTVTAGPEQGRGRPDPHRVSSGAIRVAQNRRQPVFIRPETDSAHAGAAGTGTRERWTDGGAFPASPGRFVMQLAAGCVAVAGVACLSSSAIAAAESKRGEGMPVPSAGVSQRSRRGCRP